MEVFTLKKKAGTAINVYFSNETIGALVVTLFGWTQPGWCQADLPAGVGLGKIAGGGERVESTYGAAPEVSSKAAHKPVEMIQQTKLTIVVPKSAVAKDSLKKYTAGHGINSRAKASGSSWEIGLEEDDEDEDIVDHSFDDDDRVSDDHMYIVEYEVPSSQIKAFEKFIDSLALPAFGIVRAKKSVQKEVKGNYRGTKMPFYNGNYVIEIREAIFQMPSISLTYSMTSIDNTLYSGPAIGAHTGGASPGISVGILRGAGHRNLIYMDITNYDRMSWLSTMHGQLSPVVGYDFGVMRIEQTYGMAGVTIGASFANYRSYSVAVLSKVVALISQADAKFAFVPGIEYRIFF